ncbi:MAG: ribonuclease P protein component [candidate division KSB1 bacterium]|jgi:ribonuclease P protein component|nr:ribonuclease P protein component [candidate division KSB1 bacterium]
MKENSLSKSEILSDKREFNFIFKQGKFKRGDLIDILHVSSADFKIGFAVSRRVKGSVRRNRLKRMMKEIYRNNKQYFPEKRHLILLAKKYEMTFSDLRKEILEKIRL